MSHGPLVEAHSFPDEQGHPHLLHHLKVGAHDPLHLVKPTNFAPIFIPVASQPLGLQTHNFSVEKRIFCGLADLWGVPFKP